MQRPSVHMQKKLCMDVDGLSNDDSSVWLLEVAEGEYLVLFGGDAPLPNLERIAKHKLIRPHGFKMGHHGMMDAWNEQILQLFSPEWLIITNQSRRI
ncbi:hypothetical protein [Paenibacillus sp. GCM10012304]|uniref:Uncharacterized protein n=2 Tax=Paenibacillus violae TaxID=3077234 RepID=A0ABU3RE77_9BACL|nr:hypothetical protein [Paenibacillus sp. PFR10]